MRARLSSTPFAKPLRQIRAAVGASAINPDLLTAAERIQ
jgi:hypothetical protein